MSGYIDLALSPEEAHEREVSNTTLAEPPKYPWGTSFSLNEKVLDKIDHEDWKVEDVFHFHIMAKIKGINCNESQSGKTECIDFQIIAIKGESEDAEDKEDESLGAYNKDDIEAPSLEKHGYLRYK